MIEVAIKMKMVQLGDKGMEEGKCKLYNLFKGKKHSDVKFYIMFVVPSEAAHVAALEVRSKKQEDPS